MKQEEEEEEEGEEEGEEGEEGEGEASLSSPSNLCLSSSSDPGSVAGKIFAGLPNKNR